MEKFIPTIFFVSSKFKLTEEMYNTKNYGVPASLEGNQADKDQVKS